jgi:SAM-dependent methyltransferase
MDEWWGGFFDSDYGRIWGGRTSPDTDAQVEGLWGLLALREGSLVLDAPCGYGRLSLPMAQRGARVVGADQSAELLAQAEKDRGDLPAERLRYIRHDLREPLAETGFDAAFNVFTSIGYGTEKDDLAIFATLRSAVRPGGLVFIETMHRDALVAFRSRGKPPAERLPDGTLLVEETVFDPIAGRMESTWYWAGPSGQGQKSASIRMYTATELIKLLESAGLRFLSAHEGCSKKEFKAEGAEMGGRIGILTERV